MVVGWSGVFIALGWLRQTRFATFSFDLGIYDQGVWLLSRFHDPFVTVRGLELFGHHVNLILSRSCPSTGWAPGRSSSCRPGGRAGERRHRDLPAGPRPPPRPVARRWRSPRRSCSTPPTSGSRGSSSIPTRSPSRRCSSRTGPRAPDAGVVRGVRALLATGVQGGRRARARGDGHPDRGARPPEDRPVSPLGAASPGTRSPPA